MNPRGSQTQNKELAAGEASAAMVSNENACKPRLFVSYRRSQLARVESVVRALEAAGIECFLDQDAIDPLADIPERIRQGIGASSFHMRSRLSAQV